MVKWSNWGYKMVVIKLFIEGGAPANSNQNAVTATNTAALRQSFNQLINAAFPAEKVKVECQLCGSYAGAIKQFLNSSSDSSALLLLDLDGEGSTKIAKLSEYRLVSRSRNVFFMIQEMEAWILSQPENIQKGLLNEYQKRATHDLIADPLIAAIDVQTIAKPSKVLHNLLSNHFQQQKGDHLKPLKYGKLKNSHLLLDMLDIHQLKATFIDVANLISQIEGR